MKILVEVKMVYGKPLIYPANHAADCAAELVGKRSFSERDLALLRRLGHEVVEVVAPKLKVVA